MAEGYSRGQVSMMARSLESQGSAFTKPYRQLEHAYPVNRDNKHANANILLTGPMGILGHRIRHPLIQKKCCACHYFLTSGLVSTRGRMMANERSLRYVETKRGGKIRVSDKETW